MLFARGGGQWQTYYNTLYSNLTGSGAWQTSSSYNYNTNWWVWTINNWVTNAPAGYAFSTAWVTNYTTTWTTIVYGCVQVDSNILGGSIAKEVKVGDSLILADEKTLEPGSGVVSYSRTKSVNGFFIETENGCSLICSDSAPIPTKYEGLKTPINLLFQEIGTMVDGNVEWSKVNSVREVGQIEVQHITVGNKCFWAGNKPGKYILHHNLKGDVGYTMFDVSRGTSNVTSQMTSTSYLSYWWTGTGFNTLYSQLTSGTTYWNTSTQWTTSYNVLTNRLTSN